MSRYIDADKLLNRFMDYICHDFACSDCKARYYPSGICRVDKMLREFPSADVVEVVRCKDCKYMCHYTDGHLECRLLSDLKPIPTTYCTMNADDFCSYGERREDAN